MAFNVGAIISKLTLDKSGWNSAIKEVGADQTKMQGMSDKTAGKFKKMGTAMTVAGAAITAAMWGMTKQAIKFNSEMANVATLIPGATERLFELKTMVQNLAIATGRSTEDIARGLYQVISAFGDGADTAKILEINVRAAAAGMATTTQAINLTSAVMKGYGDISADATMKTSDLAFMTVKLGQTNFPELAGSMGRVIPVAAKLNVSQEELFATFATLTGVTGTANEVSTQMRGVLTAMMKPTEDMTNAIEGLGFKTAEAMIAELGFVGAMRKVIDTTDGSTTSVGKLFTNIEALPAVFALSGGQAEKFDEKLIMISNSVGSMEVAFEAMTQGINKTGFDMARLKQMTIVLSQRLGDKLAPILGKLVIGIGDIVNKVTDWMEKNPKLTETIIKITAGVGALMLVLGPMTMMLPGLVQGYGLLKKALISTKLAIMGFNAAAAISIAGIGILIGVLAALTIGYLKVKKAQDNMIESSKKAASQEDQLFNKLKKATDQAGLSELEFLKLRDAYKGNAAAMAFAIKKGKEGLELQEALTEVSKEQKEEIDKQRVATDDLGFSMEDLTGRFQGYLDELEETKTETKTWIDYLKDVGITTVQEKETRVKELTTYLGQLKTAYDKGKLTLEDYTNATNAAKKEIEDLTTTIVTTTIPAARNMAGVYEQAVTDMIVKTEDFTVKTAEEVTEGENKWADMWEGIKGTAKMALGDMLAGNISFKNAVGVVWNDMKQRFADMVADMVINFAIDGVKELIGGATKAASGIGTALSSVSEATAPLAAGIGTLITTLATAIATAAEIIAAAAPAILIAAGVALAIYAGFKILTGLFGTKTPPVEQSQLHELRLIKEQLAFNLPPLFHGMINHLALIQEFTGVRIPLKQDLTNKILRKIKVNTDPIKKMISAARGAYVTEPTMAVLHGSSADPEIVSPASKIAENLEGFGAGSQGMNQNINVNIYVKDQLDPYSAQRITREQIVPNMLKAIEVDSIQKTRMRNILGVQV